MKRTNLMLKSVVVILGISFGMGGCKEAELTGLQDEEGSPVSRSTGDFQAMLAGENPFTVLSFNVKHDAEGETRLSQRKDYIRQIIVNKSPDVFGVQEFSDDFFKTWFRNEMSALGYGEYYDDSTITTTTPKAIFFKNSRFTLQRSGMKKLGPYPIYDLASWVVLQDKITSNRYLISNSHWKYNDQTTRVANAKALYELIDSVNTDHLPVIAFGDFNAQPGTKEIDTLKNGLDVVDALGDSEGDFTFHNWNGVDIKKIDWIMSDRKMAFTSWEVIKTKFGNYWPSDHYPVMAIYVPGIFDGPHTDANGKSANANTKFYFADVNGDGKDDKIYWLPTYDSGKPQVFLSNGNGTFASPAVTHTASASTATTTRYYFADVDGDGKADLIRWDPTLNSGHTRVYLATSNGNFSSTVVDNTEGTSAGTTTQYHFADVSGDGKADKIYWNSTFDSGKTRVFLATGSGQFNGTAVAGSVGASTTAGTTFWYADLNADGKADKILWHPTLNGGQTMAYLSNGDGNFTASSSFSSGATSVSANTKFYFSDIDGDGRADKVYWNPDNYLGKLKVYFARTNNAFQGPYYSLRGTSQSANTQFFFADISGQAGGVRKADQIRWNYAENTGELRNYFAY
ncbi:endonuclease/exonuclease/phosphatase family metal-dependent hydrolase [Pedobacter sp. AK017]|uniref:FG-GAP-like repeat-containing protein n=1 Tax=Pedobacter sp. AK017 TaxID=2723073 RepID=UPI0016134965|nr:FG-GAP-like repeat-containing protein [Pedobacter sp. AK017]MBB5438911.1 endonuclease/exonuclease/phosphatase family metal-dependent hydrolase [Pedobacter sp. AK017]